MTPVDYGLIGLAAVLIFVFAGLNVGVSMAVIGVVGVMLLRTPGAALQSLSAIFYDKLNSYDFSVIPMFILMGQLMFKAGAGEQLYHAAHKWVGHLPGGLAMATVAACAGFAAISGSAIATAATIGAVALPEMLKRHYDVRLAAGTVAAGGTLGILIPPSVTFIIYGILVNESIGALFIAGIAPGLLLALLFCLVIFLIEMWRRGESGMIAERAPWPERLSSLSGIWRTLVLFVLVIGGMFAGVFTPNEAGAVGSAGALVIGLATRTLGWTQIREALAETVQTSAIVIFIIAGAAYLSTFLTVTRIPFTLADTVLGLGWSPTAVLVAIMVMYVIAGMVMEILPVIILTVPIFAPVVQALGYDLIWFGVLIVLLGQMGMISPPVGINVFVVKSMLRDVSLAEIFAGSTPFLLAMAVLIALLVVFPDIALFLTRVTL